METTAAKTEWLGVGTLAASVLCESIYNGMRYPQGFTARSFVFAGAAAALAAGAMIVLFRALAAQVWLRTASAWLCAAAAAVAAGQTVVQALGLLGQTFSGTAGWLLAFFAAAALWQADGHMLDSTVWVLRRLAAAAAVLLLAGVWQQLAWQNLSFGWQAGAQGAAGLFHFYPEYLALPFFVQRSLRGRAGLLPLLDYGVCAGFALLNELVFGAALAQRLSEGELLRAWGLGIFSRFDSFLLLIWLMLALLRVAVLAYLARNAVRQVGKGAVAE